MNLSGDVVENPIGALQELCQRQQISMPRYEFEAMAEGFRCTVLAMGLQGVVDILLDLKARGFPS
ncbi:hypothetical protein ACSYAD_27735 [Acaryochloris marina NIES-2412]|uniref:hypothetical protein n=1 Tax=Acaryochloris marina TaxID=155978 RepID=UPI004059BDC8